MENIDKTREQYPVTSLLKGNQISKGQKAGIAIGILLTVAAVVAFICLLVGSASAGDAAGVVMMASFIVAAVGLLYFLLARINNPRRAWTALYVTVPLAVAAFVISLYL